MGSVYWPGLGGKITAGQSDDWYSMQKLHGSGTNLTLTTPNASRRRTVAVRLGPHRRRPDPAPGNRLRNTGSGRCLDVPAASTVNNTQVAIYDCNARHEPAVDQHLRPGAAGLRQQVPRRPRQRHRQRHGGRHLRLQRRHQPAVDHQRQRHHHRRGLRALPRRGAAAAPPTAPASSYGTVPADPTSHGPAHNPASASDGHVTRSTSSQERQEAPRGTSRL